MASTASTDLQCADDDLVFCAVQLNLRSDNELPMKATLHALELITSAAKKADSVKIDLFVLPELAPVGYSEDTFLKYLPRTETLKKMFQDIDLAFAQHAILLKTYICYGTIGWKQKTSGDTVFTIRQKVVDAAGQVVAEYDKIHLCDYGNCAETRFFEAGPNDPVSFQIGRFRCGLLICADMRYPELSRRLARDYNVDILLQPAAFSRDISFRTWRSFRETRAVENSVYFVAVNYAGENYGESSFVPPWVDENHEPIMAGKEEQCLVETIQSDALEWARENMPFHRVLKTMQK